MTRSNVVAADALAFRHNLAESAPPKGKHARFSDRLRHHLRIVGAAIASLAAVGAVIGGLAGYWNAWTVVKAESFMRVKLYINSLAARRRPRLSLIVLPFANLNNDPDQDYLADGITLRPV